MYLKRLDLQGFKSFPEKIKLEFNQGITAVVGPNGSGKSNISDAIRWVLGEQRAKHLRGDKMEDVIFMGTENRRQLSFAEVSITIDNTDQKLPLEYTDVKITRRVSRNGESEYSINGTNARLKDIQELFMDTGIGKEGYSIISQGRIDQILSSKGEERRKLFEEATGIGKHKTRRHEALLKLEKEQQNLMRVKDIIAELEVQIEPLEEQSKKAREYLALKESLKEVEIVSFINDLDGFTEKEKDIGSERNIRKKELEKLENEIEDKRKVLNTQKESIKGLEEEIQKYNDKIIEFSAEYEKKKGEIYLTIEQKNNEQKNKQRLIEELEHRKKIIEEISDEKRIVESRIMALNLEKNNMEEELKNKENSLLELDKKLSKKENNSENTKDELNQHIHKTTELKGEVTKNEAVIEQLEVRKKQIVNSENSLQSRINEQEVHIKAIKKQRTEKNDQLFNLKNELKKLDNEYKELDFEKSNNNELLNKEENNIIDFNSRVSLLQEMEQEKEGFKHSVKSLLTMENREEKGICGAVGELFQGEEKFENALETALGGTIQNIIVENEDNAKDAIKYLQKHKLGRSTFLPISAIEGKKLNDDDEILKEKGVLGLGSEFVSYDEKYKEIVLSLLGRTVIIDNLETGVYLSKKFRHKYRMVTLNGDMFNVGGAITGGSSQKRSSNILGRPAEIKSLKKQIEEKEKDVIVFKEKRDKLIENLSINSKNQESKKVDLQKLEMNLFELKSEIERCDLEISNWKEEINNYKKEKENVNKQFEEINSEIENSNKTISNIEETVEEIQQQLSENKDVLYSEKEEHRDLTEKITELKISLSANNEKINSVLEDKKRCERDLQSLNLEIIEAEKTIENITNNDNVKNAEQEVLEKEEIELREKGEKLEKYREQTIESKNNLVDLVEKGNNDLENKKEDFNKTQQNTLRLEAYFNKIQEDKTRIINSLWEEYELTPREAREQWKRRLELPDEQSAKDLRNQLKALGNVNIASIDQYKEVKERYTILSNQQKDIIDSEEKLYKLIEELTHLMEIQFKEQFSIISENFTAVFKELFGGGVGYLKLAEEGDILETSIDIVAQPPGKKLQNMQLLSGGEKALTAIALLFGILRMKPSPFCVLDEIEAALDDANVDRYGKYLRKFAKSTQFIVITHRKGTMEHSDVLYGVTMEEKGISKLVSVDFTDEIDGVI